MTVTDYQTSKKATLWGEDFFIMFFSHLPRALRVINHAVAGIPETCIYLLEGGTRGGRQVLPEAGTHDPLAHTSLPVAGTLPSAFAPPPGLEPSRRSQFLFGSTLPTIQKMGGRLSPKTPLTGVSLHTMCCPLGECHPTSYRFSSCCPRALAALSPWCHLYASGSCPGVRPTDLSAQGQTAEAR